MSETTDLRGAVEDATRDFVREVDALSNVVMAGKFEQAARVNLIVTKARFDLLDDLLDAYLWQGR